MKGGGYLGGYFGSSEFLVSSASKVSDKVDRDLVALNLLSYKDRLTILEGSFVHRFKFSQGLNGACPEFSSVWEKVDTAVLKTVGNICGLIEQRDDIRFPFTPRWSPTQTLLVHEPIKNNGLGIPSSGEIAPFAFLGCFLAMAEYVLENENVGSLLRKTLSEVWVNGDASSYARDVHSSVARFKSLFRDVHGRLPTQGDDGFDLLSLASLPPARKFQYYAKTLIDRRNHEELLDQISDTDKAQLLACQPPGSISWYTAFGVNIPNHITSSLLQMRLLISNIGRFEEGDKCTGVGCRLQKDIGDPHAMGCTFQGPKARWSFLHEQLRGLVHGLLSDSNVGFDARDLTCHKGILKRLRDVGALRTGAQGLQKGADILAQNIMKEPGQLIRGEMALDVTVTSKLGTPEDPLSTLKREEDHKHELYHEMYDKIGIDTYGLAVDTYGNLGPNVVKLIDMCDKYRGVAWANSIPSWATWRCRTFKLAWFSRFIVTMQIAAASKLNFVAAAVARVRTRGGVLGPSVDV